MISVFATSLLSSVNKETTEVRWNGTMVHVCSWLAGSKLIQDTIIKLDMLPTVVIEFHGEPIAVVKVIEHIHPEFDVFQILENLGMKVLY